MPNLSKIPALLVLLISFTWLPPSAGQEAASLAGQEVASLAGQEAVTLLDRARAQYGEGEYPGAESTLRILLAAATRIVRGPPVAEPCAGPAGKVR